MNLVAVTSCPTGIAHSQMAAENLETNAAEMGHEIHVEIQGAMGAENELTAERIAKADAVIIASDTSVSRDRFEDKPLVKGTVKDAVNDPESLIREAVELADAGVTEEREVETDAGEDPETEAPTEREDQPIGGDPSKGLFARLKRFFG